MSKKKKILIALAVVIGLPLIAIAVVLATFDLDETLNTQKDEYLPELEKALGRSVSVGAITTTILPTLGAEIRDVRIAGRTDADAPLLTIDRIVFGADLWTAVKSGGDEVRLEQLIVDGLAVNVVREADGSLSFDDIVQRLDKGPPPEEEPKPLSPEAKRFIRNLELDRVALERSRVTLVDKATGGEPATSTIDQLLVELDDVQLSKAFELRIAAAVFAAEPNFDLRVKLGPVPVGNPDAKLPVEYITMKADGIELAGLIPYLGSAPLRMQSAAFSADLRLDDPVGLSGRSRSSGELKLARIALDPAAFEGQAGAKGEPFDVVVKPNVEFSLADGFLDLTGFEVRLAEMAVTANGRIAGFLEGRPTFEKLTVETDKLDFGRVFALVPTARGALPPGAVLSGPLMVKALADGDLESQRISVNADLSGATVRVPGALDKPRGTALKLSVDSRLAGDDLDLKGAALTVGPMSLKIAGTVKNFENPTFNLRGGITPTPINGFVRLLPAVKEAIPPDVQVAGRFAVELKANGSRSDLDARVGLSIDQADLRVPGATLAGTGSVEVTAKGSPAGAIGVTVASDLNGLAIQAGDAFRKPAGTPLDVQARVDQAQGGALSIPALAATVGPLKFVGSGSRSAAGDLDMKIKLERFSVGELAKMLPALADSHYATARIGLTGKLKGNPAKMETIEAEMADFFFGLGPSSLSGRLSVKNPAAPVINFDFQSPFCDLNALLPPPDPNAVPAPDGPPPEVPPIVQRMTADGRLQVKAGRMATLDFRNFDARLTLRDGVLKFTSLDFDAYEGHFTAAPTTFDLRQPKPNFDIKMVLKDVSADALLTAQAGLPRTLSGRMSTQVQLAGKGLSWEVIRDSLDGSLGMALDNGRFEKLELGNAVLKGVADQIPLLKLDRGVKTRLKDLAGQFTVANGRMTLVKPMTTETAEGPLKLTGSIGLDKTLDLTGTLNVRPETIRALSQGKLEVDKALPVGLRIGGTVTEPTVSGIETEALLGVLLAAAAKAAGLEELDAARAKAEAEARKVAAEAEAKARAAANRAKAEAERRKKELEKKARDEARKAKKAAEKKAKEEAKKRLRGLF